MPITLSADRITRCSLALSLATAAGNQVMMEWADRLNDGGVKLNHQRSRLPSFFKLPEEEDPHVGLL